MAILYYKTEKTSNTGLKLQHLLFKAEEAKKEIDKFLEDINAKSEFLTSDRYVFNTGVEAVQFEVHPDMTYWKQMPGYHRFYTPRLSNKEGKAIGKRMASLPFVETSEVNDVIGLRGFLRTCGWHLGTSFFGFAVQSDWNHTIPVDCIEITGSEYENL